MQAGSAAIDITPDRPLDLEGYGNRSHPAIGTLDPLEARAIVFDDGRTSAALVSVDLCGLLLASVQRIRIAAEAACGIAGDHIMVAYSHTHSAPAATPYLNRPLDGDYLRGLEEALAEVIATASRRLQPVTLGAGEGRCDFNVNRRLRTPEGMVMRANPHGIVDKRVRVLRIDHSDSPAATGTLGGRTLPQSNPLALLFSYVCHPTVLGAANYLYSGDYPGVARGFVDRAFGSAERDDSSRTEPIAHFLPGCFGNVRPHLLAPDGRFREANPYELAVLGRLLGSDVVRVGEQITSEPVDDIAIARRAVSLSYAHVPSNTELQAELDGPRRYWAQALLTQLERDGSLPTAVITDVQVLRLGRHWLVALPGETTLEIGLSVERGLVELGLARPERGDLTLTMGYANDYVAYLPAASLMTEGGYEVTSWAEYLRCGPFTPELESTLVGTSLSLARELAASRNAAAHNSRPT